MTEAISICFDCKNAYSSKCTKIHDGVPIKGSVVKPIRGGYFRVVNCPRFESDCVKTKSNICKVLGVSLYHFRKRGKSCGASSQSVKDIRLLLRRSVAANKACIIICGR